MDEISGYQKKPQHFWLELDLSQDFIAIYIYFSETVLQAEDHHKG